MFRVAYNVYEIYHISFYFHKILSITLLNSTVSMNSNRANQIKQYKVSECVMSIEFET